MKIQPIDAPIPLKDLCALRDAAMGDLERVKKYLKEGGNINIRDKKGRSMLMLSMLKKNFDEELPLYLLTQHADTSGKIDLIYDEDPQIEIDAEINKNSLIQKQKEESSPPVDDELEDESESPYIMNATVLHMAYLNRGAKSRIFKQILDELSVDLNTTVDDGSGIIRLETKASIVGREVRNRLELYHYDLKKMLEKSFLCKVEGPFEFNPFSTDTDPDDGYALESASLLHIAALSGDFFAVKLLCNTRRVNLRQQAKLIHRKHILTNSLDKEYIQIYRISNVTPLMLASRICADDIIKLFCSLGCEIDERDSLDNSSLNYLLVALEDKRLGNEKIKSEKDLIKIIKLIKNGKWGIKPRLFLGEGNFSFAYSFIKKHPYMGSSIEASEYQSYPELKDKHGKPFDDRIAFLKNQGVVVSFGKDATNLANSKRERYKRIHFNCPHDGKSYKARTLPKLLTDFFKEAKHYQHEGDKINMALASPPDKNKIEFYQGYYYDIFDASAQNGYVLIKKRKFDKNRYPEYQHTMTTTNNSANVTENTYEFIFMKTSLSYSEILQHKEYGPGGQSTIYGTNTRYLKSLSTDSDSSDGFESNLSETDNSKKTSDLSINSNSSASLKKFVPDNFEDKNNLQPKKSFSGPGKIS